MLPNTAEVKERMEQYFHSSLSLHSVVLCTYTCTDKHLRVLGTWNPIVGDIYGFYTWIVLSESPPLQVMSIQANGRTSGMYCLPNNTPGVGLARPVQLWATD